MKENELSLEDIVGVIVVNTPNKPDIPMVFTVVIEN